ncbi:hypothetical protein BGX27_011234 [Mortierella sp. AM989]|nr:hypothetical protein BGX27_011234 [Mortierella sp. AM989]
MADPNSQFDDFLEIDSLEPSNADLYSFFFNEDLNVPSALDSTMHTLDDQLGLNAFDSLTPFNMVDVPISTNNNDINSNSNKTTTDNGAAKQEEQNDIQLLLAMNRQLHNRLQQQQELNQQLQIQRLKEEQGSQASVPVTSSDMAVIDNGALIAQLITPSNPSSISEATPTSTIPATPITTTAPSTSVASIATATAAANAQILIDSSKSAAAAAAAAIATTTTAPASVISPATSIDTKTSTATKRPSPEPIPAARKIAKTEAASIKRSETVSTTANSSETSTTADSTSAINTTLSAATLQFLLQQQVQTPLVPKLFTGKLTKEEIEDTLARLLESTRHLLLSSQESAVKEDSPVAESDDEMEKDEVEKENEQSAGQTHGLKTQPGIKTDDIPSSSDLKKMTSKERRQLRNKISARNFRVRRKEYIGLLEGQVEQHKTEARHLREAVTVVYEENRRLKEEMEVVKRQLTQVTMANASATIAPQQSISAPASSLSNESQSFLTSILSGNSPFSPNAKNVTLTTMPRAQTLVMPNYDKDVPNTSSVNGRAWKEKNPVYVLKTLVPEVYFGDQFLFGQKATWSKEDEMWDRPWLNTERVPKELTKLEKNPFLVSGVVYELMQTFATTTLNTMSVTEVESLSSALVQEDTKATVQDYEGDKRIGEALEWEMQRALCDQEQEQSVPRKFDTESGEIPDEVFQMLFGKSTRPWSPSSRSRSSSTQEDPNMLDWLYESMMASLVDLDLQNAQDQQTFLPFSEVQYA